MLLLLLLLFLLLSTFYDNISILANHFSLYKVQTQETKLQSKVMAKSNVCIYIPYREQRIFCFCCIIIMCHSIHFITGVGFLNQTFFSTDSRRPLFTAIIILVIIMFRAMPLPSDLKKADIVVVVVVVGTMNKRSS